MDWTNRDTELVANSFLAGHPPNLRIPLDIRPIVRAAIKMTNEHDRAERFAAGLRAFAIGGEYHGYNWEKTEFSDSFSDTQNVDYEKVDWQQIAAYLIEHFGNVTAP